MSKVLKEILAKTRNIGIIAHIDAGKTTSTERILFYTGLIQRMGEVDEGTTVTDWMKQERERGITITAAAITCKWRDCRINIIDTPGHVDFTVEVERCLRVLDSAVVVFCAVGGVEPQSETVWRQADKYHIPKVVFVNKMDRVGADFQRVCREIVAKFGTRPLIITMPDAEGPKFEGVVNLVTMTYLRFDDASLGEKVIKGPIPPSLEEEAVRHRRELLEVVADSDEEAMVQYLSKEDIDQDMIRRALRRLTIENRVVPVLAGSALKNKGVQPLLDAVVDFLPSPLDLPPISGFNLQGEPVEKRQPNPQISFSAYAFKVQDDPFAGQLTYLRIYSGTVKPQDTVLNTGLGKKEKIGKLLRMQANRREEIPSAMAGDIVAAIGLRWTRTGDTLCDPTSPIVFEKLIFPEPVVFAAIEPKQKGDEERLTEVLERLAAEDPTFRCRTDPETGQLIICGMGELHLEVITTRIKEDYKLQVTAGKPQVSYRETATVETVAEGVFDKVFAGKQQFASVMVEIGPWDGGSEGGISYEDRWEAPSLSTACRAAMAESIQSGLSAGVLAGYPVSNIRVVVIGGHYDEQTGTQMALRAAAVAALRNALRAARCVLMEPVMSIEIITPKEMVGDVIGDFNGRRGKISNMELRADYQVIRGTIPLRQTFGYATTLRSLTQGRGSYHMQFLRFEPKVDAGD